ncbi:MAG: glucose 1-dehydrogenase [Planctomycetes bacterium]|nr:glucose 1-dehydrogenase [Planctomycetota bacterium]
MKIELQNKVALVTGAARGIGRAIADALAESGARVVYADVLADDARAAAAQRAGCVGIAMDVTKEQAVRDAVAAVERDMGTIDILVNNAGVNTTDHRVTIEKFPEQEWDRIVNVDLRGLFVVSKAVTDVMLRHGGGRVVNIASVAGLVPLRLQCAFVAAKAGVVNLTKAMAIELGARGVLTNCVAPGSILTDGTRKLFYGEEGSFRKNVQQLLDHVPLGRPGSPAEVAHAVLFLVAPEASYVNGAILTVDGGWTAGYMREF